MKRPSFERLPWLVALLVTLITGFAVTLYLVLYGVKYWWILPADLLFSFAITYLILRWWVRWFVYQKLNPIYKTIHNISVPRKDFFRRFEEEDIMSEVRAGVVEWAKDKTREINQLREMEKYRKEFLGNVSHELKTPIFNIQGYILTLLDGGLDDPAINRMYLERTEKSINRMISIVEDLESIARLESGEMKLHYEAFNMMQLVEEVFENQEMNAEKQGTRLVSRSPGDKAVMVYADKMRIFEALNNLVVNSIKYGKAGGKTVVECVPEGDQVRVLVADNGIGINEKDIPRIFERFYRVDRSRSRNMGGTGLGLSIVKHIIEAHQQELNVKSKPGEGTTFGFTLKKA